MNLFLFDLEHTILDGDTESLWLQFLVKQQRLDHQVLTGVVSFSKIMKQDYSIIRPTCLFSRITEKLSTARSGTLA